MHVFGPISGHRSPVSSGTKGTPCSLHGELHNHLYASTHSCVRAYTCVCRLQSHACMAPTAQAPAIMQAQHSHSVLKQSYISAACAPRKLCPSDSTLSELRALQRCIKPRYAYACTVPAHCTMAWSRMNGLWQMARGAHTPLLREVLEQTL